MEQTHQYIRRLLAFAVCLTLFILSADIIPAVLSVPVLILSFSFLHARISGEKPPHLFAYYRVDAYFKKGGLRDLIRIFVSLLGFLYDTVVWTVWGVYLVFILFTDVLNLIKELIFWIIHALLWFFRQYVPFIVLLYHLIIHYLIRWPWWLYRIAYYNIPYAFNRNSLRIAFRGTFLAMLIVFTFYYLEMIVTTIPGITIIGMIISLLPLSWSFGELAALRMNQMEKESFSGVRKRFQNGIETVRSVLFYVTLFVVLLLLQLGINLLGWIPDAGVPLGSFVFNLNTLISLVLLFVAVFIVFGVIVIPSYRLYKPFSETKAADSGRLLNTILRKALQYILISIPNLFFSLMIILIPAVLITLATGFTYKLKDFTLDLRIEQLQTDQTGTNDAVETYKLGKKIEHLEMLKRFPRDMNQELMHREILDTELDFARDDLKNQREQEINTLAEGEENISSLQNEIRRRESTDSADQAIPELKLRLRDRQNDLKNFQQKKQIEIAKLEADIDLLKMKIWQIPLIFFIGGLWLVVFGSLILTFILAYLGHVYHQVYIFRNDGSRDEWKQRALSIREKHPGQPLLGGTLLCLTVLIAYLIFSQSDSIINLLWQISEIAGL